MNTTGIIILNYNNFEDTINCIQSVEAHNTAPIKFIIVDNGSTRTTAVKEIEKFCKNNYPSKFLRIDSLNNLKPTLPYITLFVNQINEGYARGNNKGLELAYQDKEISNILILNNDVLFVEDIIPELSSHYEHLKDVAILSPILYKKGLKEIDYNCARKNIRPWVEICNNFLHYILKLLKLPKFGQNRYILKKQKSLNTLLPIELPSGSCMYINKKIFQEIGSFDPNTFLYWEENILFKKVEKIHKRNYLCTDLRCIHLGASSTASSPSLFIIDCNLKSSRYYMKTYSGCSILTLWIHYVSTIFYKFTFILQKKIK